jgi:CBS-domain-containing membrane protein
MDLFDNKLRRHLPRYLLQTLLASAGVLATLLILHAITQAVIAAALGASTFIAFTLPHKDASHPRHLVGGYVCGTLAGLASWRLMTAGGGDLLAGAGVAQLPVATFGALAVGLAMLAMVSTDTEHPPAAGLALGYVLSPDWDWMTVLTVMVGIVTLALIKHALKRTLKDLL